MYELSEQSKEQKRCGEHDVLPVCELPSFHFAFYVNVGRRQGTARFHSKLASHRVVRNTIISTPSPSSIKSQVGLSFSLWLYVTISRRQLNEATRVVDSGCRTPASENVVYMTPFDNVESNRHFNNPAARTETRRGNHVIVCHLRRRRVLRNIFSLITSWSLFHSRNISLLTCSFYQSQIVFSKSIIGAMPQLRI